jgi:bifunctional DNA-binding transcriptional regulator/antitoxin component of YhaV-PrlF toxin-antitoxin module
MTAKTATVGRGRRVTIPREVLEAAALSEGQLVTVESTPEGVLLRAAERDPDQAWFWTEEWQAKEREADEDIRLGRFDRYPDDASFVASLEALLKPLE